MSFEWMAIRGSGIIAFLLLSGSTIWGLLISTKVLGRAVKAKGVTWFHESLGIASLIATGVHMFFLFNHDYIDFGYRSLFVPGASSWRPLPVALGVMSFYVLFVITTSFYVKQWIGQNAWRTIHMLSFGTFVTAGLHGVFSGTDTSHPVVMGMYIGSLAIVVMLLIIRIAQAAAPESPTRGAPRRAVHRPAAASSTDKTVEMPVQS
jgi:methionine sulfoxide reductase heme-binding subunit